MNKLQAGIEFPFAVLPQAPTFLQPSKGSFHHPSFGQHHKGMQFIALDHLNGGFQALLYTIGERLPGVAAIDQHAFNSLQIRRQRSITCKAPLRSVTSAVVTATAWGKPCVSTAICRLMPETFLPASYPFCSALSVFFTLCASTMTKLVVALRPSLVRASPTDFF